MFRLTFILCCGLFLAMLIGGQDRGQMRFGLLAAPSVPGPDPSTEVASDTPAVAQTGFAPDRPLIEPAATATLPAIAPAVAVLTPAREEPAPLPEPAVEVVVSEEPAIVPEAALAVRYVTARSVNLRGGPSTGDAVLARLKRGEAVVVVEAGTGPDGWSRIRIEGDGVEGYVATRLLSDVAP